MAKGLQVSSLWAGLVHAGQEPVTQALQAETDKSSKLILALRHSYG